ncbi:MAG: class I SAM-dependent methyltransferase [Propionibacteriaceae bacterium]
MDHHHTQENGEVAAQPPPGAGHGLKSSSDHDFDKDYWEQHWREARGRAAEDGLKPPTPHLVDELNGLIPGTALDAGCGEGADAVWLAARGWQVTAADIAGEALAQAAGRARPAAAPGSVQWVEADLSTWQPDVQFDLVTTSYAHPVMPQLDFYQRLSTWVAPGGTLLIVGHAHHAETAGHAHGQHPPAEASVTAAGIMARLDGSRWEIETAEERVRTVPGSSGHAKTLHDVVVRAVRLP